MQREAACYAQPANTTTKEGRRTAALRDMDAFSLPGFEILDKIGQGGMASVWKARQISLDRVVAIKILSPRLACDPGDVERFRSEWLAAAKLKHSGIVQVYDASVHEGIYYLVMEHVAGYSVGEWTRRKKNLSEEDTLLVAEHVARALQYAWNTAHLIHCDIKPDNIMLDADGTIKVTDLGLARTIGAMITHAGANDIAGTPNYMSPEQSSGAKDLDCRTDIYSLGASMYQMATGEMFFSRIDPAMVMEKQITDFVPDPITLSPQLSQPFCWLLDKMLVKDRNGRLSDWDAVLADIDRVRRKEWPAPPLPVDGASTIRRAAQRAKPRWLTSRRARERLRGLMWLAVALLAIATAALTAYLTWSQPRREEPPPRPVPTVPPTPPPKPPDATPDPAQAKQKSAEDMYEFARAWAAQNQGRYDDAIDKFDKVARQTQGTKYALIAADDIRRLRGEKQEAIRKVLADLKPRADALAAEKRFQDAAALFDNYNGPFASETTFDRRSAAQQYRDQAAAWEAAEHNADEQAQRKIQSLLLTVAQQLAKGNLPAALEETNKGLGDVQVQRRRGEVEPVRVLLERAATIDQRILESFVKQKDQEITVQLTSGSKTLTVRDVKGNTINAVQRIEAGGAAAVTAVPFTLDDLSPKERAQRMGADTAPEVALLKGVAAVQAKSFAAAKQAFAAMGTPLADLVSAAIGADEVAAESANARQALQALLKFAGVDADLSDRTLCMQAVEKLAVDADKSKALAAAVAKYRERHGSTAFAQDSEALLNALERTGAPPAQPEETVAPAAEDVTEGPLNGRWIREDGLKTALLRRNPGMQWADIVCTKDEAGRVTAVRISSTQILDLKPLRALGQTLTELDLRNTGISEASLVPLPSLTSLDLTGTRVNDLAFLGGSRIERLIVNDTHVKDLSPLKGLPLRELGIANTKATDFGPILEIPLASLDVSGTVFKDISLLSRMPLKHLGIGGTKVVDFAPLRRMDLSFLNLSDTAFNEMALLEGMKLQHLEMANVKIASITMLASAPLSYLDLSGTGVRDFTPLKAMPLRALYVSNTKMKDLGLLRSAPLEELSCANTTVADLEPLRGLKLAYLNLENTLVADLSPLKGAPLKSLNITGTRVHDLSPLIGCPLERLACQNAKITDYTPLRTMPVEVLQIDADPETLRFILSQMPNLRQVNDISWMRERDRKR